MHFLLLIALPMFAIASKTFPRPMTTPKRTYSPTILTTQVTYPKTSTPPQRTYPKPKLTSTSPKRRATTTPPDHMQEELDALHLSGECVLFFQKNPTDFPPIESFVWFKMWVASLATDEKFPPTPELRGKIRDEMIYQYIRGLDVRKNPAKLAAKEHHERMKCQVSAELLYREDFRTHYDHLLDTSSALKRMVKEDFIDTNYRNEKFMRNLTTAWELAFTQKDGDLDFQFNCTLSTFFLKESVEFVSTRLGEEKGESYMIPFFMKKYETDRSHVKEMAKMVLSNAFDTAAWYMNCLGVQSFAEGEARKDAEDITSKLFSVMDRVHHHRQRF